MATPTHVFVTAAEGRLVPIPANEGSAPGAALLKCEAGKLYRLPWSTYTRKRIAGGDLVLVNRGGTKVDSPEAAAAPDVLKVDDAGAIAADQRPDEIINAEADAREKAAVATAKRFDTSDTGKE